MDSQKIAEVSQSIKSNMTNSTENVGSTEFGPGGGDLVVLASRCGGFVSSGATSMVSVHQTSSPNIASSSGPNFHACIHENMKNQIGKSY